MKKILFVLLLFLVVLSLLLVVFFFTQSVSFSQTYDIDLDCDYILSPSNLINPIDDLAVEVFRDPKDQVVNSGDTIPQFRNSGDQFRGHNSGDTILNY